MKYMPLLLLLLLSAEVSAKDAHPNVLFIAIDDLNNWVNGLSEYSAKTPNIDRLARRGVLFMNAHCAAPACNPSRAAVMTGVRPSTSGVYFNWQDWRVCENLKSVVTLPQHFRDHGYKVLGGGKLYHAASLSERGHTGYLDPKPWHEYFPSKTRQLALEARPDTFPTNGSKQFYRGYFDWASLDIPDTEMGDGKVVSWAERQLTQTHEQPLFLAVGIYRPHIPWYTPKTWFDQYPIDSVALPKVRHEDLADVPEAGMAMARRPWHKWMTENGKWQEAVQAYLASVSFADAMVGRLLNSLDEGPHAKNTVIVLWSDHGYHLGHKEHWEKFALWEQTTQVPLIVAPPKGKSRVHQCDRPASLLDIYPTLVELCGLRPQAHLEGQSLARFLSNPKADSDRAVLITQGPGNHAVRSQYWRYIRYADGTDELYDHRLDPDEFNNLAGSSAYSATIRKLAAAVPTDESELSPTTRYQMRPHEETPTKRR